MVISPKFNETDNFSEGLAGVMVGNKWGYLDQIGTLVIKPHFDKAIEFSDGLACVELNGNVDL